MRLIVKHPALFERLTVYFSTAVRLLLNVLLIVITLALVVGVYKSGFDLYNSINKPLETILQQMLLDTVFIVALVEIALTILGYLKDGKVQVRYILDTILIIMLNEVITIWFKGASLQEAIGVSVILLTLGALRLSLIHSESAKSQTNQ